MDIKYRINGQEVSAEEFHAHGIDRMREALDAAETSMGQSSAGWPKTSEAMAVHPNQRAAAAEQAKKLGVPTYFDDLGRPVLTSQRHQNELAKALGLVDRGKKIITIGKGSKGLQERI